MAARKFLALLSLVTVCLLCGAQALAASESGGKKPPRSVEDIIRTLEVSSSEIESVREARKFLGEPAPASNDQELLHTYFVSKAEAHARLGQTSEAIETLRNAIKNHPSKRVYMQMSDLQKLASFEIEIGDLHEALRLTLQARELIPLGGMVLSYYINNSGTLARIYAELGDFKKAEDYIRDAESTMVALKRSPNFSGAGDIWMANTNLVKGRYLSIQGKWQESEVLLRKAVTGLSDWIQKISADPKSKLNVPLSADPMDGRFVIGNFMTPRIGAQLQLARALAMQGKLVDAELQVREAIILSFDFYGKRSIQTGLALLEFSQILSQQNRLTEASLLAAKALDLYNEAGAAQDSLATLKAKRYLAQYMVAEQKYAQADALFNDISASIANGGELVRKIPTGNLDWVMTKLKLNQYDTALQMSQALVQKLKRQSNPSEQQLSAIGSLEAYALHRMHQDDEAYAKFRQTIPFLLSAQQDDPTGQSAGGYDRDRITTALEGNISTLASLVKANHAKAQEMVQESFKLADVARGSGVQRAMTASAARANIKDPVLADLARHEQDLQQRISALEYILTDLLSAPPEKQLPAIQAKMRSDILQFKSEREAARKKIEDKFPAYADLVNPKPATVELVKKQLERDEVLVSWYFGDKESFVWAVSKSEPTQFHRLQISRREMAQMVARLRRALDPSMSSINDIPKFDVALANTLYEKILSPVQGALSGKRVLLTVPHGELGQLPLSLLVTSHQKTAPNQFADFADYKQVAWLIRDISVAQLPSVTALVTLRNTPKSSRVRKPFAGFGDPYFSESQARQASTQTTQFVASRGASFSQRSTPNTRSVNSAQLSLLPRLPDTADEILQIARELGADPEKDIFLHQRANLTQVLTTDLSDRQVVMFATHGLVPGDLDGLTQPALALTNPAVSGEAEGDGLLTLDKILTMRLNADWVILSACNTALGEGAGTEAVSGLGRAFFYAGARALLVTNWPVDSESATLLTSEMFHFLKTKPQLTKPEYLRMSMLHMIDHLGAKDDKGKEIYSYAHPLFWAPYVLVGD